MNRNFAPYAYALSIVAAACIFSYAYLNRNQEDNSLTATGAGSVNFSSDLIVWSGSFRSSANDLNSAFARLADQRKIVEAYLEKRGITKNQYVMQSVDIEENRESIYNPDGRYMGSKFNGYELSQSVRIESPKVNEVELLSRDISDLINSGVEFRSGTPRYYYTKLAELKMKLIEDATQDGYNRAKSIANFSGSSLGKLKSAQLGIFQITGQNSDEEYEWGGTFNTVDREKTATITVKLRYEVR
jgi:uncharacterized protein